MVYVEQDERFEANGDDRNASDKARKKAAAIKQSEEPKVVIPFVKISA